MSKKKDWKDVLQRAWRTFWQASISYLIINIQVIADAITTDLEVGGFETIKSVGLTIGVGALAAGLSALYNGVLKDAFIKPKEEDYSDDEMGFIPELEEAEEDEIKAEVLQEEVDESETEEIPDDSDTATDTAEIE